MANARLVPLPAVPALRLPQIAPPVLLPMISIPKPTHVLLPTLEVVVEAMSQFVEMAVLIAKMIYIATNVLQDSSDMFSLMTMVTDPSVFNNAQLELNLI